ncbi:MAG: AI-2E family transporter [Proteobacteria bacterium]|nr:AI-2E family transporter [Pseudomonadota bacterium]
MSTLEKTFALLLLGASLVAIYLLQPILTPFLVGIALAYLGDPIVDRLESLGVGRTAGVLIVFMAFLLVFVGSLLIVVPVLFRETGALIRDIPAFIIWLQQTTSPYLLETFGIDPFNVDTDVLKNRITSDWQETGGMVGRVLSEITASGVALLLTLANVALTPVVAFYMLRDWDQVMARLQEMIPRDLVEDTVILLTECDEVLSSFLRGQMLIMILLGFIYALGLTIVGLKLALVIGMLAGLASIVPYLGFFVGIFAATLAALFQFQDAIHLVYIGIVFGVGQILEGMVLTPWLVGDRIGLHPVAVIFAVLAGGQLFGFVGVLLALPVAAVIMVFVRHLHQSYLNSEYYE